MNSKEKYRTFCLKNKSVPIFHKDWWLDAVCGVDNWDVILAENKNNEIIAVLPFCIQKKIFKYIKQPRYTPHLGIWISYPEDQKYLSKLEYEQEIFTDLMKSLPKFDYLNMSFCYNITNWLPLYWLGYKQTTYYSYIIEDISDLNRVFNNFDYSKKRGITKAEKNILIKFDLSYQEFYEYHKNTLHKQNASISYSIELFKLIYEACFKRDAGKIIYATDEKGNLHGALFIVWDENSAYTLIGPFDPVYRNSGASTLLFKEAIKFVSSKTKQFDFAGSMIEGVEHSNRRFGTIQKPYFVISKINSRILSSFPNLLMSAKKNQLTKNLMNKLRKKFS